MSYFLLPMVFISLIECCWGEPRAEGKTRAVKKNLYLYKCAEFCIFQWPHGQLRQTALNLAIGSATAEPIERYQNSFQFDQWLFSVYWQRHNSERQNWNKKLKKKSNSIRIGCERTKAYHQHCNAWQTYSMTNRYTLASNNRSKCGAAATTQLPVQRGTELCLFLFLAFCFLSECETQTRLNSSGRCANSDQPTTFVQLLCTFCVSIIRMAAINLPIKRN